jgi:hypothetical protein
MTATISGGSMKARTICVCGGKPRIEDGFETTNGTNHTNGMRDADKWQTRYCSKRRTASDTIRNSNPNVW